MTAPILFLICVTLYFTLIIADKFLLGNSIYPLGSLSAAHRKTNRLSNVMVRAQVVVLVLALVFLFSMGMDLEAARYSWGR